MYRPYNYTFFTQFLQTRNTSAESDVFFSRNVARADDSSKPRGLLGAWSEALQWMVLSMTLSIFNKWTLWARWKKWDFCWQIWRNAGGSCNLKPSASFQLLLDHVWELKQNLCFLPGFFQDLGWYLFVKTVLWSSRSSPADHPSSFE